MIKVYGSMMCPDCVAFEDSLKKGNVPFEFIDINSKLPLLKEFLALRDTNEVFNSVKGKGIGIPAIVYEDGTVQLDWQKYLTDHNIPFSETHKSCDIHNHNC